MVEEIPKELSQMKMHTMLVRELAPGDKFLVREKLVVHTNHHMQTLCNQWVTVHRSYSKDNKSLFKITEDNQNWVWSVHHHIDVYETNLRLMMVDGFFKSKMEPSELPLI